MDGGVVNHGYVGDVHPSKTGNNNRAARLPSSSDSTSGYYSAGWFFEYLSYMHADEILTYHYYLWYFHKEHSAYGIMHPESRLLLRNS